MHSTGTNENSKPESQRIAETQALPVDAVKRFLSAEGALRGTDLKERLAKLFAEAPEKL